VISVRAGTEPIVGAGGQGRLASRDQGVLDQPPPAGRGADLASRRADRAGKGRREDRLPWPTEGGVADSGYPACRGRIEGTLGLRLDRSPIWPTNSSNVGANGRG
jgi:hypothetical protein